MGLFGLSSVLFLPKAIHEDTPTHTHIAFKMPVSLPLSLPLQYLDGCVCVWSLSWVVGLSTGVSNGALLLNVSWWRRDRERDLDRDGTAPCRAVTLTQKMDEQNYGVGEERGRGDKRTKERDSEGMGRKGEKRERDRERDCEREKQRGRKRNGEVEKGRW